MESVYSTADTGSSKRGQSNVKFDDIIADSTDAHLLKRTKVICTMGPCCWDEQTIVGLLDAGMNVA